MKNIVLIPFFFTITLSIYAQNSELVLGKNWVYQLTGSIGSFKTKMTLTQDMHAKKHFCGEQSNSDARNSFVKKIAASSHSEFYEGFYFYDKYFEPMRFYGYRDETGQIVLEVMPEHELGNVIERFFGRFDGKRFSGEWILLKTQKSLAFNFDILPTPISFDYLSASDITSTQLNDKTVLKGRYTEGSIFPKSCPNRSVKDSLIVRLAQKFMPDTFQDLYRKWDFYNAYKQNRDDWFKWFKDGRYYNAKYQYRRKTTSLVWCDDVCVTICVTKVYYTGYYPRTFSYYETFDLKNNKFLDQKDVFKENSKEEVVIILKKKMKKLLGNKLFEDTFGDEKEDDLVDFYFNNNSFALMPKGVVFNPHNKNSPQGNDADVKVFIPYEDIQHLMKVKYYK